MATADNSGHMATFRSAQIRQSRTSYVRQTLSEMPKSAFEKGGFINIFKVINMELKS